MVKRSSDSDTLLIRSSLLPLLLPSSLLDPAHIPVSHDKTEGGGKKENAGPMEFKVGMTAPPRPRLVA